MNYGIKKRNVKPPGRAEHKLFGRMVTVFLILVTLLLIVAVCGVIFLKIRTVEVEGSERYEASAIVAASGISVGDKLYPIDKKLSEAGIEDKCPYVSSVTIRRILPSTVKITVTEYEPSYYVSISGECFVVLDNLTVAERLTDESTATEAGLIKLTSKGVTRAIVGEKIKLSADMSEEDLMQVMSDVKSSSLSDRINILNLSSKFEIYAVCDNLYKLILGDSSDIRVKLELGEKILEDEMFRGNVTRAKIELSDTRECSVMVDNQITWE